MTEPVVAVEPSPIAAFNELLFLEFTLILELFTFEPLIFTEPVLAVLSLPMAAFNELLFFELTFCVIHFRLGHYCSRTKNKQNTNHNCKYVFHFYTPDWYCWEVKNKSFFWIQQDKR